MKKLLIGAVVGGILIFIWQFLSWTIFDLHRPSTQHAAKQDEIMGYLNNQIGKNGSYLLPNYPDGASMEAQQAAMKSAMGKPWAIISYHETMKDTMTMNIIRALLVDILMVGLFCWIASRLNPRHFSTIFLGAIFVGLIVFINVPYVTHIWFETFDLNAHLIDSIVGWGLVGIWVGWLYTRKRA